MEQFTQAPKESEKSTTEYTVRLDDPGADPINVVLKPEKVAGFDNSARHMSSHTMENSISATIKLDSQIPAETILKLPHAEDFVFYRVLPSPQKFKHPQQYPNSIWVERLTKTKFEEAIKYQSLAKLENLPLTPPTKERLGL